MKKVIFVLFALLTMTQLAFANCGNVSPLVLFRHVNGVIITGWDRIYVKMVVPNLTSGNCNDLSDINSFDISFKLGQGAKLSVYNSDGILTDEGLYSGVHYDSFNADYLKSSIYTLTFIGPNRKLLDFLNPKIRVIQLDEGTPSFIASLGIPFAIRSASFWTSKMQPY
jgi:hypothetical protein